MSLSALALTSSILIAVFTSKHNPHELQNFEAGEFLFPHLGQTILGVYKIKRDERFINILI